MLPPSISSWPPKYWMVHISKTISATDLKFGTQTPYVPEAKLSYFGHQVEPPSVSRWLPKYCITHILESIWDTDLKFQIWNTKYLCLRANSVKFGPQVEPPSVSKWLPKCFIVCIWETIKYFEVQIWNLVQTYYVSNTFFLKFGGPNSAVCSFKMAQKYSEFVQFAYFIGPVPWGTFSCAIHVKNRW